MVCLWLLDVGFADRCDGSRRRGPLFLEKDLMGLESNAFINPRLYPFMAPVIMWVAGSSSTTTRNDPFLCLQVF